MAADLSAVTPIPSPEPGGVSALVSTAWLAAHLRDAAVRVADVRWYLPHTGKDGRDEYAAGHVPGAVFVDINTALAAPLGSGPGRHPLPTVDVVSAAMAEVGIGDGTHVVAYDDAGGSIAARLWWLLRYFGHQRVSVLDGGITRWLAEGRPLEGVAPQVTPVHFTARPQPGRVLDKETVSRLRGRPGTLLLDARAPDRYQGLSEPVDARAGHIPGALSAPFASNLRDEPAPRLLSAEELRARYAELGVPGAHTIVVYCGSGITACHDLLALHLAGYPDGLLYEGSWSDWSADPTLPAATGPEPG